MTAQYAGRDFSNVPGDPANEIPQHQRDAIDWLDQFQGTGGLRRALATRKFTPDEVDHIKSAIQKSHALRQSAKPPARTKAVRRRLDEPGPTL
jgi:hypothetical protein